MSNAFCDCLLQLLFLAPFVLLASRPGGNVKAGTLLLAALLFIATSMATDLLVDIPFFEGQKWNWGGKIVSLAIALVFIFSYRSVPPRQFGLTLQIETGNAGRIFLVCAGYVVFRLALYLALTKAPFVFHSETILYQATLPGIAEEMIFRGILLTLLNRVFTRPKWTFARVSFGWAAVITSLLFGLVHGLYFDDGYHIHILFPTVLRIAFDGLLFALLTEKTKSLVPAVLLHNVLNLIGTH